MRMILYYCVHLQMDFQFLIDKLLFNLSLNSLKLNANKNKYMIFYCKNFRNYDFKSNIQINGINLELVRQCNYLGTMLFDDMCIKYDVERACSKFLKQFYSMYNKFIYLDMRSLTFLFEACCTMCDILSRGRQKNCQHGNQRLQPYETCAITNIFNHLIDKKLVFHFQ